MESIRASLENRLRNLEIKDFSRFEEIGDNLSFKCDTLIFDPIYGRLISNLEETISEKLR